MAAKRPSWQEIFLTKRRSDAENLTWGKHPISPDQLLWLVSCAMKNWMGPKQKSSARARTVVSAEPNRDKVRAVAFMIDGKVYEGDSGASHMTLYAYLLFSKQVAADTLDIWTSDEKNHGFVTEKGEFLNRPEVFRRFDAARSQDLRAKGILRSAQ